VKTALARARSRLAGFVAEPVRHARHAVKVLIKYHVMEERRIAHETLLQWAASTAMLVALWQRFGQPEGCTAWQWCAGFIDDLVRAGALARDGDFVVDR
jgi:hypothetical protein